MNKGGSKLDKPGKLSLWARKYLHLYPDLQTQTDERDEGRNHSQGQIFLPQRRASCIEALCFLLSSPWRDDPEIKNVDSAGWLLNDMR